MRGIMLLDRNSNQCFITTSLQLFTYLSRLYRLVETALERNCMGAEKRRVDLTLFDFLYPGDEQELKDFITIEDAEHSVRS
jgi:hypothetical protein